ncbi:MAG: 4Fe-4S binding protein [Richelia sp. RM2_1_2]|nr:4Fe-4S binding protein [Richelia sp. SM2_1_7]NJM18105.1 4Fe-4S binding protein [Richelia sp. SM1_7_0]NJN10798.1 4Fe-4S binding protein [Richelia sp. RM1_1_1]NJO27361.1 4Fe-4S binding protein [Richelia sp. SL_2_1]NJO57661.1 4Fe-4S binding protein [Richelia sp. RM2_1_2]
MAYKITNNCISCDLCKTVCPTNAIKIVDDRPWIDPELCKNCVDSIYSVPQCKAGCPTFDGCIKVTSDYWENWFNTYKNLRTQVTNKTNKTDYWENWFNTYSQKYAQQLQQNSRQAA